MRDGDALSKMTNLMQFARKAGKLVAGADACLRALHKGKVYMMIITEDTAPRTADRINREVSLEHGKVLMLRAGSQAPLSEALGLPVTGIFGIIDKQFGTAIQACTATGK